MDVIDITNYKLLYNLEFEENWFVFCTYLNICFQPSLFNT